MTANRQNYTWHQGDDLSVVVTVQDADGNAVDITGFTVDYALARRPGASTVLTKATGGSGIALSDAANGQFTVTLDAADGASLLGDYHHEAQVTDGSGLKTTVLVGTVTVKKDLVS